MSAGHQVFVRRNKTSLDDAITELIAVVVACQPWPEDAAGVGTEAHVRVPGDRLRALYDAAWLVNYIRDHR